MPFVLQRVVHAAPEAHVWRSVCLGGLRLDHLCAKTLRFPFVVRDHRDLAGLPRLDDATTAHHGWWLLAQIEADDGRFALLYSQRMETPVFVCDALPEKPFRWSETATPEMDPHVAVPLLRPPERNLPRSAATVVALLREARHRCATRHIALEPSTMSAGPTVLADLQTQLDRIHASTQPSAALDLSVHLAACLSRRLPLLSPDGPAGAGTKTASPGPPLPESAKRCSTAAPVSRS